MRRDDEQREISRRLDYCRRRGMGCRLVPREMAAMQRDIAAWRRRGLSAAACRRVRDATYAGSMYLSAHDLRDYRHEGEEEEAK